VMQQLIEHGSVSRGRLGVGVQEVTEDDANKLRLPDPSGVIVKQVESGGPAERAGIRDGDVIRAFNGTPVDNGNTLRNKVAETKPGTEVSLTIFRDGREQELRVVLGEFMPASENGS